MKRLLTLALAIVPLLAAAQDDLYFVPSKKAKQTAPVKQAAAVPMQRATTVNYGSCSRSDDDYNRRYTYSGDYQNAGGLYANDSTLQVEGDSLNRRYDMDDPELDYRYSRRLVRFHSPRYYSPYYWDLMYAYGAWDYLYDPFDPWYWHYGWGYGWSWGPWDCWYGGIWGWSHPYHWAYWGWGPGWVTIGGHGYHGHYYAAQNYRPRGSYITTTNRFGGTRQRTNPQNYVGRGNSQVVRSSGLRGSGLTASANHSTGSHGSTLGVRGGGSRSNSTRGGSTGHGIITDYTGGRTTANRYGQRGAITSSRSEGARYNVTERSSAYSNGRNATTTRSYNNTTSSSRSNYQPSTSSSSSSSFSRSSGGGSFSSGGGSRGGGFSSGGGASRSGGGGRR